MWASEGSRQGTTGSGRPRPQGRTSLSTGGTPVPLQVLAVLCWGPGHTGAAIEPLERLLPRALLLPWSLHSLNRHLSSSFPWCLAALPCVTSLPRS